MKIKEILLEVFNTNNKLEIVSQDTYKFITRAAIGDRIIVFYAIGYPDTTISFVELDSRGLHSHAKTGSGNELRVFSFVLESIKLLISKYNPESIRFESDADDGNRTQLYHRMSARMKSYGYTLQNTDINKSHEFVFVKNNL